MTLAQLRRRLLTYAALWWVVGVLAGLTSYHWPDTFVALVVGKGWVPVMLAAYFYGRAQQIPRPSRPRGGFDDGGRQRLHDGR